MRLFAAYLATETNSFAALPTGWVSFSELGLHHGDASTVAPDGVFAALAGLRRAAEADGHEVIESLAASASPAGPTVRAVYEAMRDEILADLARALPVDAVTLLLHGAMIAEGYDDCEGDLVSRVRALVGPGTPIGVELDLHCHLSEALIEDADVVVAYKEYPHTDIHERMLEMYRLTCDTALGAIRPTTAIYDCRMVGIWHTTRDPTREFVRHMMDLEGRDGVLSVSFGHGFPWGDVADNGAKVWVVTDNDPEKAADLARDLGQRLWREREAAEVRFAGVDEALDRALARPDGPVVLADVADNPGGGAFGDSTFILRRLIERGVTGALVAWLWDQTAVEICRNAGVDAVLDLRVGGKCGPSSGDPMDLRVTVRALIEEHSQSGIGLTWPLGPTAWVTADGIDIVLVSIRTQTFDPDALSALGLDLAGLRLIVVKSAQHFHARFAPLASEVIYVAAPGAVTPDFGALPYRKRSLNYWPRVPDPFAG